jgi:transposase-like protein
MNTNSPSRSPSATRHRPKTVSRWQAVVADFASSGLRVGEFCRTRGICEQSFYAWRKRLSHGGALSAGPSFVPVVVQGRGVAREPGDACASIELRGGRVLRLPVSMPATRMAELVHALEDLA